MYQATYGHAFYYNCRSIYFSVQTKWRYSWQKSYCYFMSLINIYLLCDNKELRTTHMLDILDGLYLIIHWLFEIKIWAMIGQSYYYNIEIMFVYNLKLVLQIKARLYKPFYDEIIFLRTMTSSNNLKIDNSFNLEFQ